MFFFSFLSFFLSIFPLSYQEGIAQFSSDLSSESGLHDINQKETKRFIKRWKPFWPLPSTLYKILSKYEIIVTPGKVKWLLITNRHTYVQVPYTQGGTKYFLQIFLKTQEKIDKPR